MTHSVKVIINDLNVFAPEYIFDFTTPVREISGKDMLKAEVELQITNLSMASRKRLARDK